MSGMAIGALKAAGADLTGATLDGFDSQAARANRIGPPRQRSHNKGYSDSAVPPDPNDLRGVANDFRGARLSGVTFRGASLIAPRTTDTVLKGGDFTDASIGANRQQVVSTEGTGDYPIDIYGANPNPDIDDVTFDGTVFKSAGFHGTRFKNVTFKGANPCKATFDGTSFEGVDLHDADLSQTTFDHAVYDCATKLPPGFDAARSGLFPKHSGCGAVVDLSDRTLTTSTAGPDLRGARLRNIRCEKECSFDRADLTGADLTEASFPDQNETPFSDAVLDKTGLSAVKIGRGLYDGSESGAIFSPALKVLKAKSTTATKLRGFSINPAELARYAIDCERREVEARPTSRPATHPLIAELMAANLSGAHVSCESIPAPKTFCPHPDHEAKVAKLGRTIFAKLKTTHGIIVDPNCRSVR